MYITVTNYFPVFIVDWQRQNSNGKVVNNHWGIASGNDCGRSNLILLDRFLKQENDSFNPFIHALFLKQGNNSIFFFWTKLLNYIKPQVNPICFSSVRNKECQLTQNFYLIWQTAQVNWSPKTIKVLDRLHPNSNEISTYRLNQKNGLKQ